jgi:hypothetical protein
MSAGTGSVVMARDCTCDAPLDQDALHGSKAFSSVAFADVDQAFAQPACDRTSLRTMLDQYLNAAIAHDPAAAPLAIGFCQTENALNVRPGSGVWKSVTVRRTWGRQMPVAGALLGLS